MATKTDILKKAMLAALEQSLGIVTTAAKASGVSRAQHYTWLEKDAKYKQAVEDMANIALDFAESKLHTLIKSGSPAATIFYLKTKGKARGYVERSEIEVTNKPAFVVSPEAKGVSKVMDVIHKKTGTNDKS